MNQSNQSRTGAILFGVATTVALAALLFWQMTREDPAPTPPTPAEPASPAVAKPAPLPPLAPADTPSERTAPAADTPETPRVAPPARAPQVARGQTRTEALLDELKLTGEGRAALARANAAWFAALSAKAPAGSDPQRIADAAAQHRAALVAALGGDSAADRYLASLPSSGLASMQVEVNGQTYRAFAPE